MIEIKDFSTDDKICKIFQCHKDDDDFVDSLEEIKQRINEIIMMSNNGQEIDREQKREIYRLVDLFNKTYEKIKFVDKSDIVPMF